MPVRSRPKDPRDIGHIINFLSPQLDTCTMDFSWRSVRMRVVHSGTVHPLVANGCVDNYLYFFGLYISGLSIEAVF